MYKTYEMATFEKLSDIVDFLNANNKYVRKDLSQIITRLIDKVDCVGDKYSTMVYDVIYTVEYL